jgi:ribA/ribD-fused uncharacterized protein
MKCVFFCANHKVICCATLGLVIPFVALGKLASRVVHWIVEYVGTTKSIDDLSKKAFQDQSHPTANKVDSNSNKVNSNSNNSEIQSLNYPKMDLSDLTPRELKILKSFSRGMLELDKDDSFIYSDVPMDNYPAGWHAQTLLSYAAKFTKNIHQKTDLQSNTEKYFGKFLFVLSFSNCHSHINIKEPSIKLPNPLSGSSNAKMIEFPDVEFYFQYFKRALYLDTITDQATKNSEIVRFQKDINKEEYKNPNNAYLIGQEKWDGFDAQKWDQIKVKVMEGAIFAKFSQHPLLREMLKATALDSRPLLQLKTDSIWGPGLDGQGANLLGECLMNVRKALLEGKTIKPYVIMSGLTPFPNILKKNYEVKSNEI